MLSSLTALNWRSQELPLEAGRVQSRESRGFEGIQGEGCERGAGARKRSKCVLLAFCRRGGDDGAARRRVAEPRNPRGGRRKGTGFIWQSLI